MHRISLCPLPVNVPENIHTIIAPNHSSTLLAALWDMLLNDDDCDLKLVFDNNSFLSVHSNIVACCSDFLKAILHTQMKEANCDSVPLCLMDPIAVCEIIRFMYTGTIQFDGETILGLLEASDRLLVSSLKELLCEKLKTLLGVHNCLSVLEGADKFSCPELLDAAVVLVARWFGDVRNNEELLSLSSHCFLRVAQSHFIGCTTEELFQSVMLWVRHDEAARVQTLPELMEAVQLQLLDPALLATLRDDPFISLHCSHLINNAIDFQSNPKKRRIDEQGVFRSVERRGMTSLAVGSKVGKLVIQKLDHASLAWSLVEHESYEVESPAVAVQNVMVFVAGGRINGDITNNVAATTLC